MAECSQIYTEHTNTLSEQKVEFVNVKPGGTGSRCPEGSRKLRFPDYVTMAQFGDKVVSLTHRPLLPPGNTPGTHFC